MYLLQHLENNKTIKLKIKINENKIKAVKKLKLRR